MHRVWFFPKINPSPVHGLLWAFGRRTCGPLSKCRVVEFRFFPFYNSRDQQGDQEAEDVRKAKSHQDLWKGVLVLSPLLIQGLVDGILVDLHALHEFLGLVQNGLFQCAPKARIDKVHQDPVKDALQCQGNDKDEEGGFQGFPEFQESILRLFFHQRSCYSRTDEQKIAQVSAISQKRIYSSKIQYRCQEDEGETCDQSAGDCNRYFSGCHRKDYD